MSRRFRFIVFNKDARFPVYNIRFITICPRTEYQQIYIRTTKILLYNKVIHCKKKKTKKT